MSVILSLNIDPENLGADMYTYPFVLGLYLDEGLPPKSNRVNLNKRFADEHEDRYEMAQASSTMKRNLRDITLEYKP